MSKHIKDSTRDYYDMQRRLAQRILDLQDQLIKIVAQEMSKKDGELAFVMHHVEMLQVAAESKHKDDYLSGYVKACSDVLSFIDDMREKIYDETH